MQKKQRALEIVQRLKRMYPKASCSLDYETPFQLLIATILSAQSTDVRVNIVTKTLFKKYPTVDSFANAKPLVLERDIHSTGFFRNKAKSVIGATGWRAQNRERGPRQRIRDR
jgi:endonuclease III